MSLDSVPKLDDSRHDQGETRIAPKLESHWWMTEHDGYEEITIQVYRPKNYTTRVKESFKKDSQIGITIELVENWTNKNEAWPDKKP